MYLDPSESQNFFDWFFLWTCCSTVLRHIGVGLVGIEVPVFSVGGIYSKVSVFF